MKRGKRKPKKGFVYILHAIHEGLNIYKFGATSNNPDSRIRYAKSRILRKTNKPNNFNFKTVICIESKDIFYTEKMITWFLRSHNDYPPILDGLKWPTDSYEIVSCDNCLVDFFRNLILGAVK